jgi:hypothetical protein
MFCIDACKDGVPSGKIYTANSTNGQIFKCLFEMLNIAQEYLDSVNFPQSFSEMRHFVPRREKVSEKSKSGNNRKGGLATFAVKVLFRQNASWQGSVSWIEGGTEESFRSVLELIFLLNSAIESAVYAA